MVDLRIEVVARNELGLIVALITPHGAVDAQIASAQIGRGEVAYVVGPGSFVRVPVRTLSTLGGAYLYANWDGSKRNNLHDLAAVRVRTVAPVKVRPSAGKRIVAIWDRLIQRTGLVLPLSARTSECTNCAQI